MEEHLACGDLAELTDSCRMAQARELLAELVTDITVLPAKEKGRYTCTVTGDVSGVLRLVGGKRKTMSGAGSPGGILTVLRGLREPQTVGASEGPRGLAKAAVAE